MSHVWSFGLVAAVAIASNTEAQPTSTGPPLWVVQRDAAAPVYVFGRMAVRSDTQWLTPAIEAAFDASDVLWLENPRPDAGSGANELIGRLGFAEGYSVLNAVEAADRDRLTGLLESAGMPANALDGRKAWLANLLASDLINRASNVDGATFPDTVFRQRADARAMSVFSEWQNLGELIEYSVALSDEIQLQMLSRSLDDSESYPARLDAWLRGDIGALSTLADATAARYPDAHRVVNVERSSRWVERISTMLDDADTEFVAVGMGHLVGPDNLLSQLRARRLNVERVN